MDATIDREEARQLAAELAERFGETAPEALAKLAKLAKFYGRSWVLTIAERAEREIAEDGPHTLKKDGERRTRGGVFFAIAKQTAIEALRNKAISRTAWFKVFGRRKQNTKPTPLPSGQ